MSLDSLLFDSSRRTILSVSRMVLEHPALFDEIMHLALADKSVVSARAMRVVCFTSEENPELVRQWIPALLDKLDTVKTAGLKMNILKIFTFQPFPLEEEQLGYLVDICFRYISSGIEKPAIKAYSLDILYKTALKEPGLIPELTARIGNQIHGETAAFKTHGRKIIQNLLFK